MITEELLLDRNVLIALLGVACDGDAGHGELDAKGELDGSADDGVESEDLFFAIGILGVPADPDASLHVRGKFGAGEAKGVDFVSQVDGLKQSPLGNEIQLQLSQFIFNSKELIEKTWPLGIDLLETQDQELNFGPFEVFREIGAGTLYLYPDLFSRHDPLGFTQTIADSFADVCNEALKLNISATG